MIRQIACACLLASALPTPVAAQVPDPEPALLDPEAARARLGELAEEARKRLAGLSYDEFKDQTLYLEETGKYYVNGDVPISNEKLLREFWEQNVQTRPEVATQLLTAEDEEPVPEWAIMNLGGLDQVWDDNEKAFLTYCVSTDFDGHYPIVVAAMENATAAWEAVAAVDFIYQSGEDSACTNTNDRLVFDVRPVNAGGEFLAAAFFPNDLRGDRSLVIDPSSFNLDPNGSLTLEGILRHELGHVIGGRHEHTRPDAGDCFEDNDWRGVTDYDAMSVMHYPQCNGRGNWSLRLTAMDKSGAACTYGPARGFVIDTAICTPRGGLPASAPQSFGPFDIAADEMRTIGMFPVLPGTYFRAEMLGDNADPGDPDLYVKLDGPALISNYDCRPFKEGASETCEFVVPANKSTVSVAIHGYTASRRSSVSVTSTAP